MGLVTGDFGEESMSSLTDKLPPLALHVGQLIGLITPAGGVNREWFSHAGAEIEAIPRNVPALLQVVADVLGPAASAPGLPGGAWYSIPSPVDGVTPTGFYLVAPPPAPGASSAQVGVGVMHEAGYADLSIVAYGLVPLFQLSTGSSPALVVGSQPSNLGVAAALNGGSTFSAPGGVTFNSMALDAQLYFSSAGQPGMRLTFGGVEGAPAGTPTEYASLQELLRHAETVGEWVASVVLQGTYWLNKYVGGTDYTVGDILTDACILTLGQEQYQLNLDYLRASAPNPKVVAENFLFNLLNTLAASKEPLVPIPVGAEGSGVYVVREAAAGAVADYGLRLMLQDIRVGGGNNDGGGAAGSPPPEVYLQIGKWLEAETDDDSWLARSLGEASDSRQPGVSLYLMQSSSTAGGCTAGGPSVSFAPRVEFVSLGLDVRGGAGQPLFQINGYTLNGAELRVYVKHSGGSVSFGAAAALDGLGLPLGPNFGSAVQGSSTNPVAQSLLESGSPAQPPAGAAPGGDKSPVNPTFGMSAGYAQGGSFAFQLYDASGEPTEKVTLPVQRALGPLQCQKLGLGWVQSDRVLSLLLDGGVHLDMLSLDLYGLTIGLPVTSPGDFSKYELDLDGLGLTFTSGQVELSGAFARLGPDPQADPPRTFTEYDGEVLIKGGTFAISGIGSYAYVTPPGGGGYASLFIFGAFDGELGGPAFFFVTGIAAGFGYNRGLVLPDMNGVPTFPLVAAASDPSTLGGLPPDPAKALAGLGAAVPPRRGEYWLAAGVRFTSFDLINSTALLVVEFGGELEIALLGVSWMSLPPPPAPGAEPVRKYAYAELGMQVRLLPSEGFFSATAVLTANSFVLDPACKLTGGFAFYVWFGSSPHAGEFVLTLGGYHPDFHPPDYYPQVPRLGFNWPMPGDVTISGDAYFALTPSAVMAGAGLQVLYSAGNLRAWFKAQMDALVEWAPFHYVVDISVSIGASYRVHLVFVTVTLKVELGASLTIWGPPMGGRVHVDWYVISFTVGFGADESEKPPPLDWSNADGTGFAQTLLPHKTANASSRAAPAARSFAVQAETFVAADAEADDSAVEPSGVLTATVKDGLLSTFKEGGDDIWVVSSNHFTFSILTTFPTTEVDINPANDGTPANRFTPRGSCGADYTVYVRPMGVTLESSVLTVKIEFLEDDGQWTPYDLVGECDFDLACHPVPAAKWGQPLASGQGPEMNAMLPGRLLGLENIKPKPPTLTPSGPLALDIDITQSFTYDTVDDPADPALPDPYHLPLVPDETPVGPVPTVKADALAEIKAALTSPDVTGARAALLAALQGFGFDPVTNSPMTALAADPGAVLVGNPLILAAA